MCKKDVAEVVEVVWVEAGVPKIFVKLINYLCLLE